MKDQKHLSEMTSVAAIPDVARPFLVSRKKFPSTLSGIVGKLKKHKARLAKRFSKQISAPNPPVV